MLSYAIKRVLFLVPVLLIISFITFSLMHLIPGDPAVVMLGFEAVDPERLEIARQSLGLDKPLHIQYFLWLERLFHGDFGVSPGTGKPVLELLGKSSPFTLELAIYALFLAIVVSIPLGTLAATSRFRVVNRIAEMLTLLGLSSPTFWVGSMFILLGTVYLRWFSILNYPPFLRAPIQSLWGFFLPALTLAIPSMATITRMVKASVLETKDEEYILTARAKGLGETAVVFKHILKNAMIPIITTIGITAGYLLSGAIVVEQVFAIPGIGRLGMQAITQRDYPTLQAVVLFAALAFVLVNLLVDLLYAYLNPKVTYGSN